MKCQSVFSEKKMNLLSAEFTNRVVKIKILCANIEIKHIKGR